MSPATDESKQLATAFQGWKFESFSRFIHMNLSDLTFAFMSMSLSPPSLQSPVSVDCLILGLSPLHINSLCKDFIVSQSFVANQSLWLSTKA